MPMTLVTGPANAGKAEVVMDAVRRHLAHGERPLLVLPTRADAEHYLRELAGEGAAMGVRVERFAGLLAEMVARAGVAGNPLGRAARLRVLAAIWRGAGAGVPGPGLLDALGETISELLVRRVTPARLGGAIARWQQQEGARAGAGELPRLLESYERTLHELGRLDDDQRALRALDALRRRPALWGAQPVLFYGFDDLTPLQLDAIETLAVVADAPVTVSLAYEPGRAAFAGRAATYAALTPLAAEHRALGPRADYYQGRSRAALSHLERSLFEARAGRVDAGGAVRLLEGGGERAELELVAEEVLGLLRDGMAAEQIAVAVRAGAEGHDLLEEVFTAAAIPYALQRRRRFADTAIGSALVGLLRCVPEAAPGPAGARRAAPGAAADLLAWLRAPGLLQRPELADALELEVRRSGAHGADAAVRMWEQAHWPIDAIERLAQAAERGEGAAAALAERAERELQRLFDAPRRGAAAVLSPEQVEEARALAAGRRALAELRELARGAPALAPARPAELAEALERLDFLSGAAPGPGAVAVLDPLALRARRVRALFACGLQEGVFPAPAPPQPFLGEDERRGLAQAAGLRLGEQHDALAAERYLLYAAVSRPEELLFLSWHVADDDGEPTARSLFVDDVCDLFDEGLEERRVRRALGAAEGAAALGARAGAGTGRAAPGLRGLSEEGLLAWLSARTWSASSLEAWIRCPARWFVERVLGPGELDPEAEPLARGALAHAALSDTLEGLRRDTGSARLTPATLERARRLLREALRTRELERPLSVAPERLPAARRRLQADLERYLESAAAAASPLEPLHLERGFGFEVQEGESGEAAPALSLGGGVTLRGRIDRIDASAGGEAVVYDYKNRTVAAPGRWAGDGTLQVPLYMLAAEESLGLRVVGGFYQPLSGEDLRPRGVLSADAGVELDCVRGDERDGADMRALLEEARTRAREAAEQARRGEVCPRPRTCGWNGSGCAYPTICRRER